MSDPYFGKTHAVFEKDVYRVLRDDQTVQKSSLVHKTSGQRTILDHNNAKYKSRSQLIMENYQNPAVTEDMLYLIDKVARLRCKDGRFGVDHSEILNYELELANKQRD